MLYHMDSLVREQILKTEAPAVQPDLLPSSMADDLDEQAKEWFHDTYAPAYVSNLISRADPERLAHWSDKISEEDRLKIRYWFSGRVIQQNPFEPQMLTLCRAHPVSRTIGSTPA
jgi:hypothetical protein